MRILSRDRNRLAMELAGQHFSAGAGPDGRRGRGRRDEGGEGGGGGGRGLGLKGPEPGRP